MESALVVLIVVCALVSFTSLFDPLILKVEAWYKGRNAR